MTEEAKSGSYLGQAWLVIILAILYGAALAAVQIGWSDRIETNKRNKIYDRIPNLVGSEAIVVEERLVTGKDGREKTVYRVADTEGSLIAWVLRAEGQGFADNIELLVSVDPLFTTIKGMSVISQKETPGLGDHITSPERFTGQFAGITALKPLTVVKETASAPHEIQAVTGATISSESVTTIINRAIDNFKQPVLQSERERETT